MADLNISYIYYKVQASVTKLDSCTTDDRLEVFNMNAAEELELTDHVVPEHSVTDC